MRSVFVSILIFWFGCMPDLDGLRGSAHDAGRTAIEISSPVDANVIDRKPSIDSAVVVDQSVSDTRVSVDVRASVDIEVVVDTVPINCVQRAIDNGYAACAPNDPYRASCDACNGEHDSKATASCKAQIDCLLRYPTCDLDCYTKCIPPGGELANFCVYKIVTAFCGVQLWHPGASWGCQKAL